MSSSILGLLRHSTHIKTAKSYAKLLVGHQQRRFLDLQEYQSKQILQDNGVRVQRFKVVSNENQIKQVLYESDMSKAKEFVIKAQVLAGGRGKGYFVNTGLVGGVQLTKDPTLAEHYVKTMLNDKLVTKQTSSDGVLVERVMVAEAVNIKREFYFAIVLDRSYDSGPILVTSPMGGMDIEEVAAKDEKAIRKFTLPIDMEFDLDTARRVAVAAFDLNLNDLDIINQCADQIIKLHALFLKLDASQIEINPLGITSKRLVICVDAKIKFDENARFRQTWLNELEKMNEGEEMDKRDSEARKHNLNFIGLDGSIGCLVNGAGLAMATMDIIKLHGGQPANFLDVGGGASVEQVKAAFEIILSDKKVKAIFVNIFGGIMRCDTVAQGIIEASKSLKLRLPIVVRLEGTRVEEAKKLIEGSNMNIKSFDDFDLAAKAVVDMANTL